MCCYYMEIYIISSQAKQSSGGTGVMISLVLFVLQLITISDSFYSQRLDIVEELPYKNDYKVCTAATLLLRI